MTKDTNGWLTQAYDYAPPQRGEIREGILLELSEHGAIIDIGLKHDGIVPGDDIKKLDEETLSDLQPGQEVTAQVMRPEDQEGSLLLSLAYAQAQEDWQEVGRLFDQDEIWQGEVIGHNRGGLLVKFSQLQVFVPSSHLWHSGKRLKLKERMGEELSLKFIEADQAADRLVASERKAQEQLRQQNLETLLEELEEGEVRRGTVTNLTNYGAFVDLGGADGLIHISEIAWRHIRHPREVVEVGDEVDVQILELDRERQRISLSLKQMQSDPWETVEADYDVDQVVPGTVTNVVDFGVFVALESGIEGLVHVSELADPPPHKPHDFVEQGDKVFVRILRIDSFRQRIELSLKSVNEEAYNEEQNRQPQDDFVDAELMAT